MNTKVKICGIRSLKAAQVALDEGADFLGLVFVPNHRHTINSAVAKSISKNLKGKIDLVGLFQNQPLDEILQTIKEYYLDYVQLHGDEVPDFINQINVKVIKTFRLPGDFDAEKTKKNMELYKVAYYLLDRVRTGEGAMLNLEKSYFLSKQFPLMFAGGLNPKNVASVVSKVKPQVVDVATGIETAGEQDLEKIRLFIKNAKGAKV